MHLMWPCGRPRRDFAPAGDSLSCSCKKGSKEHGPDSGARPAAGFPALREMLGRPKTRCVRFAHSAQTVGPSQSGGRAYRTPPSISVLLGTCIGAAANSRTACSRIPNSPRRRRLRAVSRLLAVRSLAVGCSPFGAAEQHSGLGRARSAQRASTSGSGRPFKRRERSERSAFRPAAPRREQRRASPAAGRGQRSGRVFFAYFLARARK